PTALRACGARQAAGEVEGATVADALSALVERHAELRRHLFDESGNLRRFVNVYKNEDDVRHLEQDATPLAPGDTLTIVPSIAGGDAAAGDGQAVGGGNGGAGAPPQPAARRPPAWAAGADGRAARPPADALRYRPRTTP